jgi:hypothetical protein
MFDNTVKATKIRKIVKFLDEVLAKKGKQSGILTCGHCKVGRHLRLCSKLTSHNKKDNYTKNIHESFADF